MYPLYWKSQERARFEVGVALLLRSLKQVSMMIFTITQPMQLANDCNVSIGGRVHMLDILNAAVDQEGAKPWPRL